MKSLIKNIVSVTLGLVLLVSMSGINIYSHSCEKSGYEKSSLFAGLADCGHQEMESLVCETSSHDCCSATINSKPQPKNEGCCNTSEQQFKLSIEFNFVNQNASVADIFNFVIEEFKICSEEGRSYEIAFSKVGKIFKPPAAKTLLLILHQLKTEPNPDC